MSVGFAALNATAKFGFFPAGKEFRQSSVFSLQSSVFSRLRVAVGAPGRAPVLHGWMRASFHSPLLLGIFQKFVHFDPKSICIPSEN